jgi:hypothetical protein
LHDLIVTLSQRSRRSLQIRHWKIRSG